VAGNGGERILRVDVRSSVPPGSGANLPSNPRVERFGTAHGLPPTGVSVSWAGGRPYFLSTDDIFLFDRERARFVPDSTFKIASIDAIISGTDGVLREDAAGNVWVNFGRESAVARRQPDGTYRAESQPFLRFSGFQTAVIYPEPDGVVWFGGPRRPDSLRSRPFPDVRGRLLRAHPPRGRQTTAGRSSTAAPWRQGRRPR